MRRTPMLLPMLVLLTLLQGLAPLLHAHRGGPPAAGALHVHAKAPVQVGSRAVPSAAASRDVPDTLRDVSDTPVTVLDGLEARDAPTQVAVGAAAPPAAPAAAAAESRVAPPVRAPPTALAWLHPPTQAPPRA